MGHWIKNSFILILARSVFTQAARGKCLTVNSRSHFIQRVSAGGFLNRDSFTLISYPINKYYSNMSCHMKARCEIYPRTELKRCEVPDDKVPWETEFAGYAPVEFTSESVLKKPVWADPSDASEVEILFNKYVEEEGVDRRSFMGSYEIVNSRPRNPRGRTGITGRGHLGRWGPNHAGDPVVTRWKRDESGNFVLGEDGKKILQFVSVQRRDNGEWALPGGMVNPGEPRTAALIREFGEEALSTLEASPEEREVINKTMKENFKNGEKIYCGYVDDPRNTDNAWMETKVMSFHDDIGNGLGAFKLNAGDDAMGVQWMDIDKEVKLYASHKDFIKAVVDLQNAHW